MYNINNLIKSISIRGYFTLLALIVTISVYAQELTLKGVIVDETDTPLIGATIQAKGTSTGAITDFDGKFTLKAKKGATISISYIGYKTPRMLMLNPAPGVPSVDVICTPAICPPNAPATELV